MDIRLVCRGCDRAIELTAGEPEQACPLCGAVLDVDAPPPPPEVPPLGSALRYPFSSAGSIAFLVVMAPMWGVARTFGLLLAGIPILMIGGYIAAWLWDILTSTAEGRPKPPPAPMPTDLFDMGASFLRFVLALLVSFAPAGLAAGAIVWLDVPDPSPWRLIPLALSLGGLVYYPMALLLVGFAERWTAALHLIFAVKSIRTLGRDYLLTCVFFLLTFGVSTALEIGLFALARWVNVWVYLAAAAVGVFIELALYATQLRAVGLLYLANKERLGWFR